MCKAVAANDGGSSGFNEQRSGNWPLLLSTVDGRAIVHTIYKDAVSAWPSDWS
jgi:hypothetical protein